MKIKVNSKLPVEDFDKLTITKNSDNTYNITVEKVFKRIGSESKRIFNITNARFDDYEIIMKKSKKKNGLLTRGWEYGRKDKTNS